MKRDSPTYGVSAELDILESLKEQLANLVAKSNPVEADEMKQEIRREEKKRNEESHESEPKLEFTPVKDSEAITAGESEEIDEVEDEVGDAKSEGGVAGERSGEDETNNDEEQKIESKKDSDALKELVGSDGGEDETDGDLDKEVPESDASPAPGVKVGEDETERGEASIPRSGDIEGSDTTDTDTSDSSQEKDNESSSTASFGGSSSSLTAGTQEEDPNLSAADLDSKENRADSSEFSSQASTSQADQATRDADEVAHFKGVDAATLAKLTGEAPPPAAEDPTAAPTSNDQANQIYKSFEFDFVFFVIAVAVLYYIFQPFKSIDTRSSLASKADKENIALTHLERGQVAPEVDEKNA